MRKYIVLKNWDTNQYYTHRYQRFWSKDIEAAYKFNEDEEDEIERILQEYEDQFEHVSFLVRETIYQLDKHD